MKSNRAFFTICVISALLLSGCAAADAPATQEPMEEIAEQMPSIEITETPTPTVAGAALYRGTITRLMNEENGLLLALEQAEGTDFGADMLQVLLDENTRLGFSADNLQQGDYVEIYYGGAIGTAPVQAITANLMPQVDLCVFNGVLLEIQEELDGSGSLFLHQIENEEDTIIYHFGLETQFYLSYDSLKPGDELNIFSNGITTRSLPPQANALEVRPYRSREE